jgi:outer membrane protein TolC
MQLARLIGSDLGQPIDPTTPATAPTAAASALLSQPIQALVARAAAQRPERQALVAREASTRASAQAAGAATRPQVAALAGIEPARPNARFVPRADTWNTSWDLGVNVTWSVFDSGRARAQEAAALAQAQAIHDELQDFDRGVEVEVRQRLLDIEAARASLDAAGEAVSAAAEARRVVGERFAVGVATSTDVLTADVALLQAQLDRTRWSTALRTAEARLLRTVGESW